MPFNWLRIPDGEVEQVSPLESHDNEDGTSWVLVDASQAGAVQASATTGPYPTAAAAKRARPYSTRGGPAPS